MNDLEAKKPEVKKPKGYVVVNINSKQFMLSKGQSFDCDRLEDAEGSLVSFPIIGSSKGYADKGSANFKIVKHFLGKKRVVFYKTQRNADEHYGGKGSARPYLTRLELINYEIGGR